MPQTLPEIDPTEFTTDPRSYDTDRYIDLLFKRQERKAPRRKIAVVGAGISGLICASQLLRSGHEVTIFEASKNVGGRIKTLRGRLTGDFYAEAGAMRIPDTHRLTHKLIERLGLKPVRFESRPRIFTYVNRTAPVLGAIAIRDSKRLGFDLDAASESRWTAAQLFEITVQRYLKTKGIYTHGGLRCVLDSPRYQEALRWLDQLSLQVFLEEHAKIAIGDQPDRITDESGRNISKSAVDMICMLLMFEPHLPNSMAAIVSDYFELFDDKQDLWRIPGGMDLLPNIFIKPQLSSSESRDADLNDLDLSANVIFGARVVEIVENARTSLQPVRVVYENPVARQRCHDDFNLVVISTPFSSLRHIRLPKQMTQPKRRSIRQLYYDNACKILLEFNSLFWEGKPGHSITDLPIRQTYYPSAEQGRDRAGRYFLLASYTWGSDALRWTSLTRDDRIRFALRDLCLVHGKKLDDMERILIGGVSHSWAEDEFTSGAFAMFQPYQYITLFKDIWFPSWRLHFCGEHTSTKHAWIEGAVESGIRAAQEVITRIQLEHGAK